MTTSAGAPDRPAADPCAADLLEHLCGALGVPACERAKVAQTRSFMLGDAAITLDHEEWSHFIKVYVELGRPTPADEARLHRFLLASQMRQPAPFIHVLGIDDNTGHAFLCCAVPFPEGDEALARFVDMLMACVHAREQLREQAEGIAWT